MPQLFMQGFKQSRSALQQCASTTSVLVSLSVWSTGQTTV